MDKAELMLIAEGGETWWRHWDELPLGRRFALRARTSLSMKSLDAEIARATEPREVALLLGLKKRYRGSVWLTWFFVWMLTWRGFEDYVIGEQVAGTIALFLGLVIVASFAGRWMRSKPKLRGREDEDRARLEAMLPPGAEPA